VSAPCPLGACDGSGFVIDEATNAAVACECRPARINRARAASLSAVIPKRFQGVSFDRAPIVGLDDNILRPVRKYIETIDTQLDEGSGLWFTGDVGTGKTSLAMLVSKSALEAGRSVAIYSLPRLLAEIRKTFEENSDHSYLDLMSRLADVDLLHVDDVGVARTNEWVLEELYSIVNARYEGERAMIITTNLRHHELAEQLGERTASRFVDICGDPLLLFGTDKRVVFRDQRQAAAS
jgi:DNA replication protein DnaC